MKFRNISDDARVLPALGQSVEAGGEFVVTGEEAAGLLGQVGQDNSWLEPADDDAAAAVAAYNGEPAPGSKKKPAAKETV